MGQNGTYLLAAYLPSEGVVLMEVELAGKGSKIQEHELVKKGRFTRESGHGRCHAHPKSGLQPNIQRQAVIASLDRQR